ncbi:uncharacterized protein LOC142322053 isoform X2 [Lycorma delicatula]|uniref:uncharacterized protein LOC142322053 isoform X2 n=1 Tax=Lycorma delicatula TaxID=130591 RepID=UPI003F519EAE
MYLIFKQIIKIKQVWFVVMSGDAADRNIEQDILNNTTESELQSLSHVEEPNESVYMVCGVLIAMMLVGLIIVLLAVTISSRCVVIGCCVHAQIGSCKRGCEGERALSLLQCRPWRAGRSKLRKREDTLPTTTATPTTNNTTSTTTTTTTNHNNNVIQQSNNHNHLHSNNQTTQQQQQQQSAPEVTTVSQTTETLPPPFLWVYHSNGNSTTASSQYTLYNNDQDNLVHNLQCEEPRECKGFRKNLRGKWRRLVKKKPQQEAVYTIPAELRDQLKQIYVY